MKITDEARKLRDDVAKLRPDKRRRYGEALRARILDWVSRVEADGGSEIDCSKFLGIKTWRFRTWRQSLARSSSVELESLALVPSDTSAIASQAPIAIVGPSGYRVEGLSFAQVIVVLRELA